MQTRLRWWLIGIILLTIASLLAILRPITLQYRIDPDTKKSLDPKMEAGPFKIYAPVPDLLLGLDLKGGTQLRLQLQKTAIFTYRVPEILEMKESEERTLLQGEIGDLLPPEALKATDEQAAPKRNIEVTETDIRITTNVKDEADMERQQAIIDVVISQRFPDAMHVEGSPDYIEVKSGQLNTVKNRLEDRINKYGVSEAIFQTEEPDKILVELPGVKDPELAKEHLRETAMLEFRLVPARYQPSEPIIDPKTGDEEVVFYRILPGGIKGEEVPVQKVLDESTLWLTGKDLKDNAEVQMAAGLETAVILEFKPEPTKKWAEYTRKNVGRYVATVLDGKILTVPVIRTAISGATKISGGFNGPDGIKRANNLKIKLNAGALPVDILPVEQREVSATLGEDSLRASLVAGIIGFLLVLAFMIFYYRLPGVLASIALLIYLVLLLAALKMLDARLTLPGIFGIILSVGMAVDANIIIFERLKEELRTGKTMRAAIEAAFKRAWTAILDSNVCSILTGLVLYWLGTGPVKGFATTLIIGVFVSMFTAVAITRLFMDIAGGTNLASRTSLFGVSEKDLEAAR